MLLTAVCEVLGGLVLVQFSKSGHFSLALSGAVVTSIGMHALGLAQHESFHRLLFKSPKLNDNVGRVLCSWFLFTQFAPLKRLHLAHHRGFGLTADPDRWHWDGQRNSRQSLGLLFQILLFRRIWFFGDIVGGGKQRRLMSAEFPWIILVQASICVSIVVFAGPMVYFVGWFVPLFSLMPLLEHVRVQSTIKRLFVYLCHQIQLNDGCSVDLDSLHMVITTKIHGFVGSSSQRSQVQTEILHRSS